MKTIQYQELVDQRKACRRCAGLHNPSEGELRQFDSEEIGPWSRLYGNLNAEIMVVGQDWGDTSYYKENKGLDKPENPTTKNLQTLLDSIGVSTKNADSTLFLTNAILCLKEGNMQKKIEHSWVKICGKHFLKPQIDLVSPKIVIALGERAYRGIMGVYDLKPQKFRNSVESEEGVLLPNGSILFSVYHCGSISLNMNRKYDQQVLDWRKIGRALQDRDQVKQTLD